MKEHLYSYKFRLYPSKDQEALLSKHFGHTRFVYNHFLAKRIEEYNIDQKTSSCFDNINELPKLKEKYTWLKETIAQSLQASIEFLQEAYNSFFKRCKKKKKGQKGFPKFKKRHDKQSFRVKQNIKIVDDKLIIPKFLEGIELIQDRKLEGHIRFATISKNKAGQYYASITVKKEIQLLPINDKSIGIDLNVFAMVNSNTEFVENPLPVKKLTKRLKYLNQELSRKIKGSKGKEEARVKLAKLNLKIHNQREDHLHKLSKTIINENQIICVEDLSVESMLIKKSPTERKMSRGQERNLHRDIVDAGFYSFIQKLMYKSIWYGRELIKIDRWFPSSQLCHCCNWQYKDLPKSCKEWTCWNCFEVHNRDYNAAMNILNEGLRTRTSGTEGIAACPDVRPMLNGLLVGAETTTLRE